MFVSAKPVLRYLKGIVKQELCYRRNSVNLNLFAFSDAHWAADQNDRRSTTGSCFSFPYFLEV